jgi:hypothetical protein
MVESVNRVLGYHLVQMTDLDTPEIDGVDEVIRLPMLVGLMPYRLKHLAQLPYRTWVTFDTDIIIKKPLSDVWDREFDVAVTERGPGRCLDPSGKDIAPCMPFNTGVMFSREPVFWREAYEWLRKQPGEYQDWWGDQLAVSHVAHERRYHVLVLPGCEFNWTPKRPEQTSEARVWHYKGAERKQWLMQ